MPLLTRLTQLGSKQAGPELAGPEHTDSEPAGPEHTGPEPAGPAHGLPNLPCGMGFILSR